VNKPCSQGFFRLLPVLLCSWLLATATASAGGGALFRVGDKTYTLEDIAGVPEKQLRQRFRAEIKDRTDEQLMKPLDDKAKQALLFLPPEKKRVALEEPWWHDTLFPLLLGTLDILALAATAENIIREQGVDVESYFDLDAIRTTIRKEVRYIDLLYTDPDDKSKDKLLLRQLIEVVGIPQDEKRWLEARATLRRFPPLRRWTADFCRRSPLYEEIGVKAVLAYWLVRQAAEQGSYHRKALERTTIDFSAFAVYEIEGYAGDRAALDTFFRSIIKDGLIPEPGVEVLLLAFRKEFPGTTLRASLKLGSQMLQDPEPLGVLMERGPGRYRIVGWHGRVPFQKGNKAHEMTLEGHAFHLAAEDYFPVIEPCRKNVPYLASKGSLRGDALLRFVAPDVPRGKYVKKPYPAELFDTFREARARRQTFVVRAAAATANKDTAAATALVKDLLAEADKQAPKLIQDRYRELARQVAQDFKLEAPGNK